MTDASNQELIEWVAGNYMLVKRAPLPEALRNSLVDRRRTSRRRAVALLIALPLPMLAGVCVYAVGSPNADLPIILGICGTSVILPFLFVFTVDYARISRMARRNLRDGEIKVYKCPDGALPVMFLPPEPKPMITPRPATTLETYTGTGHLASIDGAPAFSWWPMKVVLTAPVPPRAADPTRARALTRPEQDELQRCARRVAGARSICATLVIYSVSALGLVLLFSGVRAWWYLILLVAALGLSFLATLFGLWRLRLARLLRADRDNGVVEGWEQDEPAEVGLGHPASGAEILPVSRVPWTFDGLPAPWRRLGDEPLPVFRTAHDDHEGA